MIKFSPLITVPLLMLGSVVYAQQQEQVLPSERKQQTVITEPITLYKGFLRAGISTYFISLDKLYDSSGNAYFLNENAWTFSSIYSLDLSYGVTDRFQLGLSVPFKNETLSASVQYEIPSSAPQLNDTFVTSWERTGSGLSDVELFMRYQLMVETTKRPALRGGLRVVLPTGEKNPTDVDETNPRIYTTPTGYGEVVVDANLLLRKIVYPYSYTLGLSYTYHLAGQKVFVPGDPEIPFKSSDFFFFNGSFNFHLNDWISFQNEIDYFIYQNNGSLNNQSVDLPVSLLQYVPYISFQIKRLRLLQGANVPLTGKNTGADIGYFLIAQYTF